MTWHCTKERSHLALSLFGTDGTWHSVALGTQWPLALGCLGTRAPWHSGAWHSVAPPRSLLMAVLRECQVQGWVTLV
jgi:hypothetical protein